MEETLNISPPSPSPQVPISSVPVPPMGQPPSNSIKKYILIGLIPIPMGGILEIIYRLFLRGKEIDYTFSLFFNLLVFFRVYAAIFVFIVVPIIIILSLIKKFRKPSPLLQTGQIISKKPAYSLLFVQNLIVFIGYLLLFFSFLDSGPAGLAYFIIIGGIFIPAVILNIFVYKLIAKTLNLYPVSTWIVFLASFISVFLGSSVYLFSMLLARLLNPESEFNPGTGASKLLDLLKVIFGYLLTIGIISLFAFFMKSIKSRFYQILAVGVVILLFASFAIYRYIDTKKSTDKITAEISQKARIARITEIKYTDFQEYPEYNPDGTIKAIKFKIEFASNTSQRMNIYPNAYLFNPQIKYVSVDRPSQFWLSSMYDDKSIIQDISTGENIIEFTVTDFAKESKELIGRGVKDGAFGVGINFSIHYGTAKDEPNRGNATEISNVADLSGKAEYYQDIRRYFLTTGLYKLSN